MQEEDEAKTDEPFVLPDILSIDNQIYGYHLHCSPGDMDLSVGDLHSLRFRWYIQDFLICCHCCCFHYHVYVRGVFPYLMAHDEGVMDR